ncbi:MAG: proline dehydrogenase family protein [Bacteroidota bacterium]|uniref:Carbapenem antibiotics biosynthesis protein carD n=1 Tax=Christiangramia flava JLT2011 TaxID=1229726 RepID=A0A1L7I8I4_9FLAO|nr:proline dehydrogenase family protein [Christiangramia flava]APU69907.1 Carbapenem antibiotics biosynthesis protein carD [Christiangramia flava JLT2011]MAM18732.1 proline dehydrogenase [Christiangramia sp.]MEE2771690.1 proline dehydrogenase family protein [Bacteroidota bacterium]OSS37777.1 Carbapenem antibiotics biosynthesis protein carD [Christiangramia flava JLT2011]|tara:strand:- start:442 stop:1641 length:1200 start_codon:yes stop_codon:yes gene_type:complete
MIRKKIFNNTKAAFKLKSDSELDRAIFLFGLMGRPSLVKAGSALTKFSLKFHLPVEGLIKKTIFEQFCGGVTEKDCEPVTQKMYSENLHAILDYSVEGKETEEEFDAAMEKKLSLIEYAKDHDEVSFAMFKPTGIGRFEIWEKVSEKISLSDAEKQEWENVRKRVETLCQRAYDLDVRLYADGEETWMQTAADELMEEMMRKYNKEKVLIYNTLQCYRWDRLQYLKDLHEKAKKEGFKIGAKIVRGAYMEKENARAKKLGYPTPICESKEATDVNFNSVMSYCLNHLDDINVFIGTHNEVSNYLALQIMEDRGIDHDDPRIWFSQLFGMSDHLSYNLARKEYNAVKLVPFGPVRDVVPYLLRRAQENTSVKGQTGRELSLLLEERKRRKGDKSVKHTRE